MCLLVMYIPVDESRVFPKSLSVCRKWDKTFKFVVNRMASQPALSNSRPPTSEPENPTAALLKASVVNQNYVHAVCQVLRQYEKKKTRTI